MKPLGLCVYKDNASVEKFSSELLLSCFLFTAQEAADERLQLHPVGK